MTFKPHSQDYFGAYRNHWWNQDFLKLMLNRLNLEHVTSILDVGAGQGHWTFALLESLMNESINVTLVDQERDSLIIAEKKAKEHGHSKCTIVNSKAENIPLADNQFDLVTCQTLLIHIQDPAVVLLEMKRLLRPGGTLLLVEPNNAVLTQIQDSLTEKNYSIDDKLLYTDYFLRCQEGKRKLGDGFISIGDHLPRLLHQLNFSDIKSYLSDKCSPILPPYTPEETQDLLMQHEEWFRKDILIWEKITAKKYYLAGGGNEKSFSKIWQRFINPEDRNKKQIMIESANYFSPGSAMMYLTSGVKNDDFT